MNKSSALADWTPEQIALSKKWVETWRLAGEDLEQIRRKEIRELDTYQTIALLCGSADYTQPPYAPKPWSGLIDNKAGSKRQRDVNEIIQAAAELQAVCQSRDWQFCFIGGLALQRWSEPPETVDVDLLCSPVLEMSSNSVMSFSNISLRGFPMPRPLHANAASYCFAHQKALVWMSRLRHCPMKL